MGCTPTPIVKPLVSELPSFVSMALLPPRRIPLATLLAIHLTIRVARDMINALGEERQDKCRRKSNVIIIRNHFRFIQ